MEEEPSRQRIEQMQDPEAKVGLIGSKRQGRQCGCCVMTKGEINRS